MPVTEDGVRAEICLNPLGIINRLNPSQLIEQHINFMSNHVVELMKKTDDYNEKESIFFEYLKLIDKDEYDFFDVQYIGMNRQQKQEFLDSIETDGIFIHQAPFFDNASEETFKKILVDHPEWCEPYKFEGIEKPMVMGEIYFLRLKHESSNKLSVRSAGSLNVKNLPSKSTEKKEKRTMYSKTPIRLGEMEVTNLMIAKEPELVEKLLKTYSTSEELREQTLEQLLLPGYLPNGKMRNSLNMEIDVNLRENKSISREILDKYFNLLGFEIVDNLEEN